MSCSPDPKHDLLKRTKSVLVLVQNYEYGKSRSWLQEYKDVLGRIHNEPDIHGDVEGLLIDVLKVDASNDAKLEICKTLSEIGSDASLPTLETLLENPESSHMALFALRGIPGSKTNNLLLESLNQVEVTTKIGIINTLALRKVREAVAALESYLDHEQASVRISTASALGSIGGQQAAEMLYNKILEVDSCYESHLCEALVNCARDDELTERKKYFRVVFEKATSASMKFGAFKGLLGEISEDNKVELIIETLKTSSLEFQESVVQLVRDLPQEISLDLFIDELPDFQERIQVQLALAIADRGDSMIKATIIKLLNSENSAYRIAALKGMRTISSPEDIALLAGIASAGSETEHELAHQCLYWMKGEIVDERILTELDRSSEPVKIELLRSIGYRKIEKGHDNVLKYIEYQNKVIKSVAIETIGKIGNPDVLEKIIDIILENMERENLEIAVSSITNIAWNLGKPKNVEVIKEILNSSRSEPSQIAMIYVLGDFGGTDAYIVLKKYISHENQNIQFACLKALSNWENDTPLNDLEGLFEQDLNRKNRTQALVAIINLVQGSSKMTVDEKSEKIRSAFEHTNSADDRKILINGISRINSFEALDFVISMKDETSLQETTENAIIRLAGELRYHDKDRVVKIIDELIRSSERPEFQERLDILKRSINL